MQRSFQFQPLDLGEGSAGNQRELACLRKDCVFCVC